MLTSSSTAEFISVDRGPSGLSSPRAAGIAGLLWACILVVTNIINAAISPAPGATVDEVTAHLTDDRVAIAVVTAGFVAGIPLVLWFLTGLTLQLHRAGEGRTAIAGLAAFAIVLATFGMAAGTRLALVAAANSGPLDDPTTWALWKLHDVMFAFNSAPLAVALATFGTACANTCLAPRPFRVLAPLGAVLLIIASAVLALSIAEGAAAPLAVGGVGFLIWLSFVIASAYRLATDSVRN
jgi:hypothetical protein